MKKIVFTLSFLAFVFNGFSQSKLDKSLSEISDDIAYKLIQKNKKKIVVLYITDINKEQSTAGKYLADLISYNLVNYQGYFEVFDRDNLSGIAEAKKLISEGYIDAASAKELGKILAVEAIIVGNYTVLSSTLKLTIKALDVNSGLVIAASMKDLPLDADAGVILGINIGSDGNSNVASRGFNGKPLNSNENYNNPGTVNKQCEEKKTGDYCFQNNYSKKLNVSYGGTYGDSYYFTLDPNQTQCIYDIQTGPLKYFITEVEGNRNYNSNMPKPYNANGQVYIEQCKSKTFIIK